MSLRAIRWGLLALVGLGLVATLIVVSVADPPGTRSGRGPVRGAPVDAGAAPLPVLGQAPQFSLVDRSGETITTTDLLGEPWVADFVFTRCGGSCPRLTSLMLRLGAELPGLRRVSITVDPVHDTPEVLADYARAYSIDDPSWLFLTGPPRQVRAVVVEGFKLPIVDEPPHEMAHPDEPILHSDRFVLIDRQGAIRGYYEATDEVEYERLRRDIRALGRDNGGMTTTGSDSDDRLDPVACEREVVELHEFLESWFSARLPASDEAFARFESVLAPRFTLVDPAGEVLDRSTVVEGVRGGHGRSTGEDLSIRIEKATVRHRSRAGCLVTYEEWHDAPTTSRGRLSSVLLVPRSGAPNGVEWLHLHETWLPGSAVSGAEEDD